MSIKKLFFETVVILTVVTLFVVFINSFQIRHNAAKNLEYLQKQYLNATYEIYNSELVGNILVGNKEIMQSLLNEISKNREVGTILTYGQTTLSTGKYENQLPKISYELNLGNKTFAKLTLYLLNNLKIFNFINGLVIPLLLEIFIFAVGLFWLLSHIKKRLLNPLNDLVLNLEENKIEKITPNKDVVVELKQLYYTIKKMYEEIRKKAKYEAEAIAAKEVAHDIRSPLACLSLLLSDMTAIPENQRILMRSSIQRIRDIANILQNKAEQAVNLACEESGRENTMISSLIELLITEKRVQLVSATNIQFDLNLNKAYGLFANVNVAGFKRVFSNLIDNSLESFDIENHHIFIIIEHDKNRIFIHIKDDGCGIPERILDKIGTYGFSYGKEHIKSSGSGIGIHHALKIVNSFGGSLSIESKPNIGTHVTISLPKSDPPNWFVNNINLKQIKLVVILDDDVSIHNLWNDRLSKSKNCNNFSIFHFSSAKELQFFLADEKIPYPLNNILFLIDYELVGQEVNGLDLIEQFNLGKYAMLVTSHHGESAVKAKAIKLNVGIIPKEIAPYIPLL